MSEQLKKCTKCCREKPVSQFNRMSKNSTDLRPHCRECRTRYTQDRRNNMERTTPTVKRCTKCHILLTLEEFHTSPDHKDGHITICKYCTKSRSFKRYGLTELEVENMVSTQQGMCALCFSPLNGKYVIDHSHTTGKVRGLLHYRCNSMLAAIEHTLSGGISFVDAAKLYLKKAGSK